MTHTKSIEGGLYLVIDPKPGIEEVGPKVKAALRGGVDVLQIWNHWGQGQNKEEFVETICTMAQQANVPVLLNEDVDLLYTTSVDGIHFDNLPDLPDEIRQKANRPVLIGITCGNDIERIQWAVAHHCDYISFCAMFPSSSVDTCEIVSFETVQHARLYTRLPIFASGGVTPENMGRLMDLGINGIAVISGILKADDPEKATQKYKEVILTNSKP